MPKPAYNKFIFFSFVLNLCHAPENQLLGISNHWQGQLIRLQVVVGEYGRFNGSEMTHDSVSLLYKLVISCLLLSGLGDLVLHYIIRVRLSTSFSFSFPQDRQRLGYQQLQWQCKKKSPNVFTFIVMIIAKLLILKFSFFGGLYLRFSINRSW